MSTPETIARNGPAGLPDGGQTTLAVRGDHPVAFAWRCIPRRARLGTTRDPHHGLRGSIRTTVPTLRGWWCLSGVISLLLGVCACAGPMEMEDERQGIDAAVRVVEAEALGQGSAEPSSSVTTLTGGRTKVVWIQDLGDGTDVFGLGGQLALMGIDTADGRGERAILDTPGSYAKPLITPAGSRIIFGDRLEGTVMVVDWTGNNLRQLADGFPLAVWEDPNDATEWVYIGSDPDPDEVQDTHRQVHRLRIDRPEEVELVWDRRPVSDGFQVSRDGRVAAVLGPWPDAGVVGLPNGEWRPLGNGCWTALARDDSHLFWYFDGQHRNLTIVDTDAEEDRRWTVNINGAPGIDGFEVYHPRWSNHPRFLVMTGPYAVGGGGNKIRAGGQGVEVYVGRFSPDHTAVEAWIQVTANDAADFYPDVWIDPAADVPASPARDAVADAGRTPRPAPPASLIVVDARVSVDVTVPTPRDIAPYRNGLLVLEYEVLDVIDGRYDETTLLAAHWIIRDATLLDTAVRAAGSVVRMTLEPYTAHPELEGERLVMDSDRFDLPLFYDIDVGS